jgi:hypothetical protein
MADPTPTQEKRCLHQNSFKEKFGQDINDLLPLKNPDGTSLINFGRGILKKFHIYDIEVFELIALAVIQGLIYTEEQEIMCPIGWMRKAMYRIAQNHVRKNIVQEKLLARLVADTPIVSGDQISKLEFEDQRNLLKQARKPLSVDDQEILGLYFDDGKSYEEIRDYYGHKNYTLEAVRQRVCRARKRLIAEFCLLSSDQFSVQEVKKLPKHVAIKTAIEPKIYRW